MAMKRYNTLPRYPEVESHHQIQFRIQLHVLRLFWEGVFYNMVRKFIIDEGFIGNGDVEMRINPRPRLWNSDHPSICK